MFELKNYQKRAKKVLENFLVSSQKRTVECAFEQALIEPQSHQEKTQPYRHYATPA